MLTRRFSIGSLLMIVAILGVALAALRRPSYLWANAVFTVALFAIIAAVVSTVFARDAGRAYWLGFAIFGGTYLAICSLPALRETVCPRLLTEVLLDVLYPVIFPEAPPPSPSFTITAMINGGPVALSPARVSPNPAPAMPAPPITPNVTVTAGPAQPPAPSSPQPTLPSMWILPPSSPASGLAAWTAPDRSTGVGYQVGVITLAGSEAFRQIGHSLMVLLVATLGGEFARNRYHANVRAEQRSEAG